MPHSPRTKCPLPGDCFRLGRLVLLWSSAALGAERRTGRQLDTKGNREKAHTDAVPPRAPPTRQTPLTGSAGRLRVSSWQLSPRMAPHGIALPAQFFSPRPSGCVAQGVILRPRCPTEAYNIINCFSPVQSCYFIFAILTTHHRNKRARPTNVKKEAQPTFRPPRSSTTMPDLSNHVRRGHPIAFGLLTFVSLIVAIIASVLTSDYNKVSFMM